MKRRGFFQSLLAAPVAAAVPAEAKPEPIKSLEKGDDIEKEIGGSLWLIHWTGWKGSMNNNMLAAQAVAFPICKDGSTDRSRPYCYASFPGCAGTFMPGDVFNLGRMPWQPALTDKASDIEKALAMDMTLKSLFDYIETHKPIMNGWQKYWQASEAIKE